MRGEGAFARASAWIEHLDPGAHRRIKGLRLVTAYALAAMCGALVSLSWPIGNGALLPSLAGGFALWASVSEGESDRRRSSRDLAALTLAAAFSAAIFVLGRHTLARIGVTAPELMLVAGAFLVGYLRRFGLLGTGTGSQIYIGLLLAYGDGLTPADLPLIGIAGLIALPSSVVPRLLSGPAERPVPFVPIGRSAGRLPTELAMGLQAAIPALAIVMLNAVIGLTESAWAVTASTYVVAGTSAATILRIRHRVIGTLVGVAIGIAFVPLIDTAPLAVWSAAAAAMMIYAVALPERYDVACGAFAFTLMITLALGGERSVEVLSSRAWETLLGCGLGFVVATWLLPLRRIEDA